MSLFALSFAMSLVILSAVPKDDWRGAVAYVNKNAAKNDLAWIDPTYNRLAVLYYDLVPQLESGKIETIPTPKTGDIWFFAERTPGQTIPSSPTEQFLNSNLELKETIPFYRLEVRRYRVKEQ